jgi:hypothetical protein
MRLFQALNQQLKKKFLLALDAAGFHKTPAILQKLRIIAALVPPGCTGLLQLFGYSCK